MGHCKQLISFAIASTCLTACGTPFGGKLSDIHWDGKTRPGTIAVSDPKMFRREALINERREEVAWINELLKESKVIEFKPEILREVETIQAFSAALSLNFDPAAGINFRRQKETGDLQQEINTLRLQLQLDQLKRDAQLIREKFAAQTETVNADIAQLGEAEDPADLSGPDAAQAAKQLTEMITTLQNRLDAETKGPLGVGSVSVNPIETFRDRTAYRNLLKNARSAATLDELHDQDSATLLRLTFQATVIPAQNDPAAPGVLQMRVKRPQDGQLQRFYRNWINYENRMAISKREVDNSEKNFRIGSWEALGFQTLAYNAKLTPESKGCDGFSLPLTEAAIEQKKKDAVKQNGGVSIKETKPKTNPKRCRELTFLTPQFIGVSVSSDALKTLLAWADEDLEGHVNQRAKSAGDLEPWKAQSVGLRTKLLENRAKIISDNDGQCTFTAWFKDHASLPLSIFGIKAPGGSGDPTSLFEYLEQQHRYIFLGQDVNGLRAQLTKEKVFADTNDSWAMLQAKVDDALLTLQTFEHRIINPCQNASELREQLRSIGPNLFLPPAFQQVIDQSREAIFVYDVGPREQVQQVGTNARAANSLGLALALAGTDPSSGIATNASASYARQASGKVQARERVPAVTGYAVGGKDTFGWVLGPTATLNPKGKLELEQALKPHDLTVDLSVPAWWDQLNLDVLKAWSPKVGNISAGTLSDNISNKQSISLSLPVTKHQIERFSKRLMTTYIIGADRSLNLDDDKNQHQFVSACRPTAVRIVGDGVWRTRSVLVNGHLIAASDIMIAPDMQGAVIKVPALESKIAKTPAGDTINLVLQTPYQSAPAKVQYIHPKDKEQGCKKTKTPDPFANATISDDILVLPKDTSKTQDVIRTISMKKGLEAVQSLKLNGTPIGKPSWNDEAKTSFDITLKAKILASLDDEKPVILTMWGVKDKKPVVLKPFSLRIRRQ